MSPIEILKQAVDSISANIPKVVWPQLDAWDEFFNLGKILEILEFTSKKPELSCKVYTAKEYRTRHYRDAGCAAYKLIRFLEQATDGVEELFWRYEPQIVSAMHFDSYYKRYAGITRFSVFSEKKLPKSVKKK